MHSHCLMFRVLSAGVSSGLNQLWNSNQSLGNDKQTATVKIIDPEDSIRIKYNFNEENETVKFECNVNGIAPIPEVKLL